MTRPVLYTAACTHARTKPSWDTFLTRIMHTHITILQSLCLSACLHAHNWRIGEYIFIKFGTAEFQENLYICTGQFRRLLCTRVDILCHVVHPHQTQVRKVQDGQCAYNVAFIAGGGECSKKKKGKSVPLQAWTGPEGSRRLRLPDFKTIGT